MTPPDKIVWQDRAGKETRPFLQPIAVAIVCAVFLILILIMGIMDMRRLDQTLVGIMENYQQADGTILIPEALQPYMGGQKRIEPFVCAV